MHRRECVPRPPSTPRQGQFTMGLVLFNMLFVVALLARPSPATIAEAMATWTPLPHGMMPTFLLLPASDTGSLLGGTGYAEALRRLIGAPGAARPTWRYGRCASSS